MSHDSDQRSAEVSSFLQQVRAERQERSAKLNKEREAYLNDVRGSVSRLLSDAKQQRYEAGQSVQLSNNEASDARRKRICKQLDIDSAADEVAQLTPDMGEAPSGSGSSECSQPRAGIDEGTPHVEPAAGEAMPCSQASSTGGQVGDQAADCAEDGLGDQQSEADQLAAGPSDDSGLDSNVTDTDAEGVPAQELFEPTDEFVLSEQEEAEIEDAAVSALEDLHSAIDSVRIASAEANQQRQEKIAALTKKTSRVREDTHKLIDEIVRLRTQATGHAVDSLSRGSEEGIQADFNTLAPVPGDADLVNTVDQLTSLVSTLARVASDAAVAAYGPGDQKQLASTSAVREEPSSSVQHGFGHTPPIDGMYHPGSGVLQTLAPLGAQSSVLGPGCANLSLGHTPPVQGAVSSGGENISIQKDHIEKESPEEVGDQSSSALDAGADSSHLNTLAEDVGASGGQGFPEHSETSSACADGAEMRESADEKATSDAGSVLTKQDYAADSSASQGAGDTSAPQLLSSVELFNQFRQQ